ncbi:SPOR domain-containing protein [Caldithrix abyssi]
MVTGKIAGNYLSKLFTLLTIVIGLNLIFGCAAAKKKVAQPAAEESAVTTVDGKFDESFDPLSLEDDDIVIKRKNRGAQAAKPGLEALDLTDAQSTSEMEAIPDSLLTYKEVDGFRVQIFAGRSVETATMTKSKAQIDFEPHRLKVYFIFEAPFYKIRIGDFTDRNQAERARELARKIGYREAFVVRSKVRVAENVGGE